MTSLDPTQTDAWAALVRHRDALAGTQIRSLFESDPDRFTRFSHTQGGLTVDLSKQRVTAFNPARMRRP